MSNIVSIIIVAILGVIGNIIYFEYRLKKEHKREISKEQLTKLLLPLYIILKTDELEFLAWDKVGADLFEYESNKPDRLFNLIKNVLDKNLYLADEELQMFSLLFIEWGYREDSGARFQELHNDMYLTQDKTLNDFRDLVYKKYNEQRKKYLK